MYRLCTTLILLFLTTCHAVEYDIIFIGAGTSNSIVASHLVDAFPDKQFLILEAGSGTSKDVGGNDYPSYFGGVEDDQKRTILDVPGEYTNFVYKTRGDPYKLKETFTWQGMGYGGNSQFFGGTFQCAPDSDFESWPEGWKAADMKPYYDRLFEKNNVTSTPSTDGIKYNTGFAEVLRSIYQGLGFTEEDTSRLGNLGEKENLGFFSTPYVLSDGKGGRGSVLSYLKNFISPNGTSSRPNLDIITLAKVERIIMNPQNSGAAVGVEYRIRDQLTDTTPASPVGIIRAARLTPAGRVIVGAGALMTARLLYLSAIGPKGLENNVFSGVFPISTFLVDNPGVGYVHDHVGVRLGMTYSGTVSNAKTYNYADYIGNAADISNYVTSRTGPYAQYDPTLIAYLKLNSSSTEPDYEAILPAGGVGGTNAEYNTPNTFQVVLNLLRPQSRARIRLDSNRAVTYPIMYLAGENGEKDLEAMTDVVFHFINSVITRDPTVKIKLGPGGTSHPAWIATNRNYVKNYVSQWDPFYGVPYSRLVLNHFVGTCPLSDQSNYGTDPSTLLVKGTYNIHVVDASLIPKMLSAQPIATVMAVAEKASDILINLLSINPTDIPSSVTPTRGTTSQATTPTSSTPTTTTTTTTEAATTTTASRDTTTSTKDDSYESNADFIIIRAGRAAIISIGLFFIMYIF